METEDVDVPVAACGWGQLYEQDKRVKDWSKYRPIIYSAAELGVPDHEGGAGVLHAVPGLVPVPGLSV